MKNLIAPRRAIAAALAASLLATPLVAADEKDGAMPAALAKLAACQAITEDKARLACFDREAGVLIAASNDGEVKVVDKEEAKQMRKSLFGFSLPKIALFSGKDGGEEQSVDETLASTITRVRTLPTGYYQITIAEGDAVWETIQKRPSLRTPKVGDPVEFEKAALGTYWIRINGQMGVKGKRVG